jgi:outer membrane protein assembly factor BamB
VGGDLVLVGTSEAEIVALDWADGHEVWRTALDSQVLSKPAANTGTVVAHALGGDLYGLDAASGERRWMFDRNVPVLSLRGSSSPLLIQDVVIAGFANGNLVALEAKVGRQLWEAAVAIPHGRSELERMVDIDSEPQIWGSAVYAVAFHGRVVAIDGRTGTIIWNRDMSSSAGLSVDYRSVYVTDQSSNIWALDRETGGSMWRQDKLYNRNLTAPVPIEDFVVAGDFEGYLHALNASNGELAARVRVDTDGLLARPLVADNVLYVYGNGGTLAAYRFAVP